MSKKSIIRFIPDIILIVCVLLGVLVGFAVCLSFNLKLGWLLLFIPAGFLFWMRMYMLVKKLLARAVYPFERYHDRYIERVKREAIEEDRRKNVETFPIATTDGEAPHMVEMRVTVGGKEMLQRVAPAMADDIQKVVEYTEREFRKLDFSEEDIRHICQSVKYLILFNSVVPADEYDISMKPKAKQGAIKNYAWNISNAFHLNQDLTAQFVKNTFRELFKKTEVVTIAKNLRTTTPTVAIKLDEHLLD